MPTQTPRRASFLAENATIAHEFSRILACTLLLTSVGCTDVLDDPLSQAEPVSEAQRSAENAAAGSAELPACQQFPAAVAASYIAFDSDRDHDNRDLYLIRADGSGLRRLSKSKAAEREAAFSPDGNQLAFVSDAAGSDQIYLFDFATGESRQLTQKPGGADQPAWFPDGERLAFHSGASVFMIDARGQDEQLLGTGLNNFNAYKNPAVSIDGTEVLVDRNNEINAINVQTLQIRPVIRNTTIQFLEPAVSLDGSRIAYSITCRTRGGQITVAPFLMHGSQASCDELVSAPDPEFGARNPAWGPENYLAYEHLETLGPIGFMGEDVISTSSIVVVSHSDDACQLEQSSARDQNPSWAPEGFALPDDFSPF
jgi:Tol biopolymer transport system component